MFTECPSVDCLESSLGVSFLPQYSKLGWYYPLFLPITAQFCEERITAASLDPFLITLPLLFHRLMSLSDHIHSSHVVEATFNPLTSEPSFHSEASQLL